MPLLATLQLSVATGAIQVATALQLTPALTLMLDGQPVKTGGVLSSTITKNEQLVVKVPSKAVYLTIVVPKLNSLPGPFKGGVTDGVLQSSEATGGIQETTALQLAPAEIVISDGQPANTGGLVSLTVTKNEQLRWFPLASVAEN